MTENAHFKARLTARETLLGAFVKTPHPIIIEIMGRSAFDFLVLDAEHAPFDRSTIDTSIIAARSVDCPVVVRVHKGDAETILGALDSGAVGVMIPHVKTPSQACDLVRAVRFGPDGRGFAGTTRAAEYSARSLSEHFDRANDEVVLICQIEDAEGYSNHVEIAAVDGVDGLFIGRADLAVSYGKRDISTLDISRRCAEILATKNTATGLYCNPDEDVTHWKDQGASFFVIGSEHTLISQGAKQLASRLAGIQSPKPDWKKNDN